MRGFIITREVLLALSVVLLNLTFWLLVAEPPQEETQHQTFLPGDRFSSQNAHLHSAHWRRWGITGLLLRWSSLIACLTVGILQLLWRLIPAQRRFSGLYVGESTLQSTLTATFVLKLLLNMYISPLSPWWKAVRPYLAPLVALLVGVSISVGDLMICTFHHPPLQFQ